ncbi:Phytosulfokine receptor 1 [Ananas comosus]|uniref:Phytosulfokine receptor 1 n=1 Tax=Ananas comosus TaxID=4615 RepID=A0A199UMY9_ANACO|nr:Phytosulfokine receptor 1 [Ananas comosus]
MLSGLIPAESNLPSIRVFNISVNSFNGTHPILAGSSSLSVYDVSSNSFSGPVDTGICNSSDSIQVLRFSANMFFGDFLAGFGNCSSLSELSLDANGLPGTLPDDLFTLSSLTKLNLQGNSLSGIVSTNIRNLSNLVHIDISSNNFSGVIPNVFDSLNKLEFFSASSNELTGGLPPCLSNCSRLATISLRNNSLTGTIDLNFAALPMLNSLRIASNFFSGCIPADLPKCTQMTTLSLSRNNLVSEIPSSFKNFTSLYYLSLTGNNFSNLFLALQILQNLPNLRNLILSTNFHGGESMPEGIKGFANTQVFVIANCALTGSIPPWLANLTKLKVLDISWNHLTGMIPLWLGNLDNLFYLDISSNMLTGEIPTSLTLIKSLANSNLSQENVASQYYPFVILTNSTGRSQEYKLYSNFLSSIILSNNKLVGSILPGFNGLVNLHVLDLNFNDISGTIYTRLVGHVKLRELGFIAQLSHRVAYNNLSGKIPTEGQFNTLNDLSIYIGNYYLCGPPTKNNCSDEEPNPYPKRDDNNESSHETIWLYLGMGSGFAIGFWCVYAVLLFRRSGLPCFCSVLLLLRFAPLSCSQSQQSCDSSDLNALRGVVEGLQSSDLGWSFNGSSSSSDCCTWVGISCDLGSALVKRVIGLDLSNKSLKGSVSSSLGDLDQLKQLNLSNNSLNGSVPVELFHLPHLELLDLSMNMLSGLIPAESNLPSIRLFNISANSFRGTHPIFAGSSNLSVYDVSSNSFSGPVDTGICNSSDSIQVLRFSANMLSGEFPVGFGNCSSLSELSLDANGLTGTLPDDLFTLSSLTKLNLQGNSLSGTVSNKIRNLSNLVRIDTSSNNFSGVIPNVFDSLHKLEFFDASSNELTGGLPPSLSNCSTLITIRLNNNSLTGNIDLNFTALPRLKHLSLGMNFFSGRIPYDLPNCLRMQSLNLGGNNLVGEIPSSFRNFTSLAMLGLYVNNFSNLFSALQILQNLPNLTYVLLDENFRDGELMPSEGIQGFANTEFLSISDCSLSGSIPPWLANLTKLKSLDISSNCLSRRIPSWLGNLDSLFYLDFSSNLLTGEIPTSLTRMRSLMYGNSSQDIVLMFERNSSGKFLQYSSLRPSIILSNNKLVGSILPGFNTLVNLHVLDLSFNDISGTIPDLSGMSNLESLDLSHNHLTGAIPPSLSRLHFLSNFSVAYNNLSGQIPTGGQFDTLNDPSIYMDNYYLCGPPTVNNCSKEEPNPYTDGEGNNETKTTWSYFGTGLGFAIGFWSVCVWLLGHHGILTSGCFAIEREALLTFKAGIIDTGNRLSSWAGQDCCSWQGVVCDSNTSHVVKLNLQNKYSSDYSLRGEINPSLLVLTHLSRLDLSGNDFGGISIPKFIGSLKSLMHLDLSSSNFSGEMPVQLGNLSNLRYLDLSYSYFICIIPSQFSNLSRLHTLRLEYPFAFSGTCVDNLSWLPHLFFMRVLHLDGVDLSNTTDWLEIVNTLHFLTELALPGCHLTNIPTSLSYLNFTSLKFLDISDNGPFNTTLPTWLWNLTKLSYLNLGNSGFHGKIPHSLGNLISLNTLYLESNNFEGKIPTSIQNLCNLVSIDLSSVGIGGDIAELVGPSHCPWKNVETLMLGNNRLHGSLFG